MHCPTHLFQPPSEADLTFNMVEVAAGIHSYRLSWCYHSQCTHAIDTKSLCMFLSVIKLVLKNSSR